MIFIPGIVNFLGLSIVGIIYKLLVKNEKRKNILHIIAYIRHYDIINKSTQIYRICVLSIFKDIKV